MIDMAAINWTVKSSVAPFGNIGIAKRTKPYRPIFSRMPARITEPAVGASVCASGSQVWNGNMGTFTAKATKNPQEEPELHFRPV